MKSLKWIAVGSLATAMAYASTSAGESYRGSEVYQVGSHDEVVIPFSLHTGQHMTMFAKVNDPNPTAKLLCSLSGDDTLPATSSGSKCGIHLPNNGESDYLFTIHNNDTVSHTITFTWTRTAK